MGCVHHLRLIAAAGRQSIIDVSNSIGTLLRVIALLREPPSHTVYDFDENTSTRVIGALTEVIQAINEVPRHCVPIASAQLRQWLAGVPGERSEQIVNVLGISGMSSLNMTHCISDVYLKGRSKRF